MSAFTDTARLRHQVHAIRKRVTGTLAGKERTYQLVWAGSFDVEDPRAKCGKPIGDGTPKGALPWIERLKLAVKEFARETRVFGKPEFISANVRMTLYALLSPQFVNYATGEIIVCKVRLAAILPWSLRTVERHIVKLRACDIIDCINRTIKTGLEGVRGPQVMQTANCYGIDPETFPEALRRTLVELGEATWAGVKKAVATIKAAAKARGDVAVAEQRQRYRRRIDKVHRAHRPEPVPVPKEELLPPPRDSDRRNTAFDRDPATIAMRLRMEAFFEGNVTDKVAVIP